MPRTVAADIAGRHRGAEEAVITFRELDDAARALAARLTKVAQPGDRVILVFPPASNSSSLSSDA
jgi:acyl-CoA synthetase (AMP-forming)/AMP-acid ligase II